MTRKTYNEVMDLINNIDVLSFESALGEPNELTNSFNKIGDMKKQIREILKNEIREINHEKD